MSDGRREELRASLSAVRARVAAAEVRAGRAAGSVRLVVVTKTYPASDVTLLAGLGVEAVGESREPEASTKAAECAEAGLRWHQVGQVQTRAAPAVASWADVVHSVDRARLVRALEKGAAAAGRHLDVLLQVSLDPPSAAGAGPGAPGSAPRAGAAPGDVAGLAELVAATSHLRLAGVMGIAPRAGDPAGAFDRLAQAAAGLRAEHPGAVTVSAGMSGDLEAAIGAGATLVRVGTAVLGSRPPMP